MDEIRKERIEARVKEIEAEREVKIDASNIPSRMLSNPMLEQLGFERKDTGSDNVEEWEKSTSIGGNKFRWVAPIIRRGNEFSYGYINYGVDGGQALASIEPPTTKLEDGSYVFDPDGNWLVRSDFFYPNYEPVPFSSLSTAVRQMEKHTASESRRGTFDAKTPKQPRVTIRRKKYRGEDGYLVAGIFVKERATAEEIKSAYKRGASPDEISDIVMGQKHVSESVRSEYYANRKLLQERRAAKQESLKAELATPVRSDHALAVDRAFDAKNTVDASDAAGRAAWSKSPGRMDMRGQDTKADRPRRPRMGR
jgi:hypothetical protein